MTAPLTVTATIHNDIVAEQLAQFCKRVGFQACYDLTEAHLSHEERKQRAYQMLSGLDAVAAGLRDIGFSPR